MWADSFTLRLLCLLEDSLFYLLDDTLRGLQMRSGDDKNLLAPSRIEPGFLIQPPYRLVNILTVIPSVVCQYELQKMQWNLTRNWVMQPPTGKWKSKVERCTLASPCTPEAVLVVRTRWCEPQKFAIADSDPQLFLVGSPLPVYM
jgi:hypothetical protein